jgi:pSer/pThr/pTyr-binding forkhead associated (FHA) protein
MNHFSFLYPRFFMLISTYVTLDVSTKGAVCFVNGARVGDIPQKLYHGDRIALGESASYVSCCNFKNLGFISFI